MHAAGAHDTPADTSMPGLELATAWTMLSEELMVVCIRPEDPLMGQVFVIIHNEHWTLAVEE